MTDAGNYRAVPQKRVASRTFHVKHTFGVWIAIVSLASVANAQETPPPVQVTTGVLVGLASTGIDRLWTTNARFAGELRADALFGRSTNASWGVGPLLKVGTYAFHEVHAGLGPTVLIPIYDYLPLVFSAGLDVHHEHKRTWQPAAFASLFWGPRSFNYSSAYNLASGLVMEARRGLGADRDTALVIGVQIDAALLALPAEMAINLFR